MNFISELIAGYRNVSVEVEIDPILLNGFDCLDIITTDRTIQLNLYQIIMAIGLIQSRRRAPSKRQKFFDKSDLLEHIEYNNNVLKLKVTDIVNNYGSETLGSISGDFGVGLSLAVLSELYNIDFSTIERILGNGLRPDWSCYTEDNRKIIVEAKGTSRRNYRGTQITRGLLQKASRTGNIKIVSSSYFEDNQPAHVKLIDPPINDDGENIEIKKNIAKAGHYASMFSFLGYSSLSIYFSQMRNRLLKTLNSNAQQEKDTLYRKIKFNYPVVRFLGVQYHGRFSKVDDDKFIFVGVDKNLLSYEDFISFKSNKKNIEESINNNKYFLFRDGILIIEISDINIFSNIVNTDEIAHYQEDNTISDIDSMKEKSFLKYIKYLLKLNDFIIKREIRSKKVLRYDLTAQYENMDFIFELKLCKKRKKDIRNTIDQLKVYKSYVPRNTKIVVITNIDISEQFDIKNKDIILIGRKELMKITKSPKSFLNYIV